MKIHHLIFSIFFSIIFSSCDKIETPYKEIVGCPELGPRTRRILVEDYTGHTCGNCPSAALVAQNLKDVYCDQVIIMGVHAGFFAKIKSGPKYTTDFTNEDSQEYDVTFGNSIAGNPNGMINRTELNGSKIIQPANWETALLNLKDLLADVSLDVTSTYDGISNSIDVEVDATFFNTLDGSYSIVVSFVEDNIVDWQKDYTKPSDEEDIEDYQHKHVYRGNINGTWGDVIDRNLTVEDTEHTFTYTYTPDPSWDISQSSLIAYIYNTSTYEILQVAESHVDSN